MNPRTVPPPSQAAIGNPGCDAASWRGSPRRRAATGSSRPAGHESTSHLFAHSRRMMSCSIIDDLGIVEGGRPNQIVGPDDDHGQAGNARTGPRAWGTDAPPAAVRRVSGSHGDLDGRWREEPRLATSPKFVVVNLITHHEVEADEQLPRRRHLGLGLAVSMHHRRVEASQVGVGTRCDLPASRSMTRMRTTRRAGAPRCRPCARA